MASGDPVAVHGPNAKIIVAQKTALMMPAMLIATAIVGFGLNQKYGGQLSGLPDEIRLTIMAIGAGIIVGLPVLAWLIWVYAKWEIIEYRVYETELEERRGVFSKTERSAGWGQTTDVTKNETFFERVLKWVGLGVADLKISTAGEDGHAIHMKYVKQPEEAYELIQYYIDKGSSK